MASQTITALGNAIINLVDRKTPIATANTVGMVKPDGSTINIDANGVISSNGGGGSGLELCDIGMALYVDESKGLRRYLNGQIVDINANTQAFLNRLKQITTLYPSLLCTENEWQTAKTMSAFGQVGKFVFNYSGSEIVSVRLPRVVNVQGLFDLQNLGMTVEAGLPNIKGWLSYIARTTNDSTIGQSGAFYDNGAGAGIVSGGSGASRSNVGLDASLSNPIYGNSDTVQQEAIQYPYFIQIATGSETEANIINTLENVNGFTLLESKYSDKPLYNESWLLSNGQYNLKATYPTVYEGLQVEYNTEIEVGTTVTLPSGVSYTKRGLSVKLSTETYTDYDFVLNTAEETFRLPLKTNLASGKAVVGNGRGLGITNGLKEGAIANYRESQATWSGLYLATNYELGHINTSSEQQPFDLGIQTFGITTDGTKSGIETSDSGLYLYFYVGDIDQNHGIVNMGRIGEQVASLTTVVETYQNGASWYRVYSDGWCEQGGYSTSSNVTIKLLKTYANTNYTITLGKAFNDETNTRFPNIVSTTKTTAQFKVTGTYNNTVGTDCYFYWETKGYMA